MSKLHQIIERFLILVFVVCFGLVNLYVPHNFNKITEVEAGGPATGGASEITQLLNNAELIGVNAATTASVELEAITASMTSSAFALDNVIDGLAWAIAKNTLSEMTSSMLNWINSGFEGSPAFITDFKSIVTQIADDEFGLYLDELGGPFSFICSPFKLDVTVALATSYEYQRSHGKAPAKSNACTLSGAIENVDRFIDGSDAFVQSGGWASFFVVTTNSNSVTPLGSILSAQAESEARITNARGEELKLLDFGDGFLSSKICETVGGATNSRKNCTITTPGKIINEALTFQTSTGQQSLVEADEINEIVSALFAQVTQEAITGAAGLLGLSGGTGFNYSPRSFTTGMSHDLGSLNPNVFRDLVVDALAVENDYLALINTYSPLFNDVARDPAASPDRRFDAEQILTEMNITVFQINTNTGDLNDILRRFDEMMATSLDPTTLQGLINEFTNNPNLHSGFEVDGKEIAWESFLNR